MGYKFGLLPVCIASFAAVAGGVALAGVLYESGVRTPWLERFQLTWAVSSDGLAERAYTRMLAGDQGGALELFRLAVGRDPASPYRWCDYAEAMLAGGDASRARECIRRGIELGPYIGPVLMRGVNFAYRTGDRAGTLQYGNRLLALTGEYDRAVFSVWERMELPAPMVLDSGIPNRRAAQAYHRSVMERRALEVARASWHWATQHGFADDRLADEYAGFLLRAREPEEASHAWAVYVKGREPEYPGQNAIYNGSFERAPTGTVFDWKLDQVPGAEAERDAATSATGKWSMRLRFDRTHNLQFAHVSQRVVLQPGTWRFQAQMRTEGITTNEGLGFRIYDVEAPQRLDVQTERLTGSQDWTPLAVRLDISPATHLICVQVVRKASLKFDNKLGGTAWIDGVTLHRDPR